MIYHRPLYFDIMAALKDPLSVMHIIIGPRQVGKTTIAKQIQETIDIPSIYASADSPTPLDATWVETQWRRALTTQSVTNQPILLILDELQKIPGWSEVIKVLWDSRRPEQDIRVLILGSSALLLKEGLTESLAGRFFLHRCHHWSYSECKKAFGWSLEKWLYFGGYPGAVPFTEKEAQWKAYITDSLIETTLAKDVLQMHKITKPALLRNLFGMAASLPAQIVSYTKMLGQFHDAGNTTTLAHYLKLLEGAFLVSGLEAFSRGVQRKRGSSPKLILWNNALINAISELSFDDAIGNAVWWGRLVENAVGAYLISHLSPIRYSVTYWREGNYEVDFVVSDVRNIWAIEVKSGRSGRISGIERFKKRYPEAKTLMVGGSGIPLEEFFDVPAQVWFTEGSPIQSY